MVRNYKRKTEDRWTKEDLLNALMCIKNSELKINDAARTFGISRATLYRQYAKFIQGGAKCDVNQFRTCGGNPILTKVEEDVLEKTITDLRAQGFTVGSTDIKRICFEYCDSNGIPNQFNAEKRTASDDWYYGFLKRHPSVGKVKSKTNSDGTLDDLVLKPKIKRKNVKPKGDGAQPKKSPNKDPLLGKANKGGTGKGVKRPRKIKTEPEPEPEGETVIFENVEDITKEEVEYVLSDNLAPEEPEMILGHPGPSSEELEDVADGEGAENDEASDEEPAEENEGDEEDEEDETSELQNGVEADEEEENAENGLPTFEENEIVENGEVDDENDNDEESDGSGEEDNDEGEDGEDEKEEEAETAMVNGHDFEIENEDEADEDAENDDEAEAENEGDDEEEVENDEEPEVENDDEAEEVENDDEAEEEVENEDDAEEEVENGSINEAETQRIQEDEEMDEEEEELVIKEQVEMEVVKEDTKKKRNRRSNVEKPVEEVIEPKRVTPSRSRKRPARYESLSRSSTPTLPTPKGRGRRSAPVVAEAEKVNGETRAKRRRSRKNFS